MIKNILKMSGNITYFKTLLLKTIIFSTLISMILWLSGCSIIPKEEEVLAPKLKEPPKVVYETLEIKKSTFEKKIEVTGNFVPVFQKDLSFLNSNGRLKTVNVELGDQVKKGDILAELVTENLGDQIKEQELVLKKSQLALYTIKLNGQKDNKLLEKQLNSLRTELENMQFTSDAYSQKEIKDFKEQVEEKEIVYKNSVDIYKNSIKVAENDTALSQLKLDNLRQALNNSRLTSTMDGTVYYITDIQAGTNIDAFTTVVSVADTKKLQLVYSGDNLDSFTLGTKVSIKIYDQVTEGEVVMTPANLPKDADDTAKTSIRIKIAKLPPKVVIGDYAQITLYQLKKDDVIVIDKNIIRIAAKRKFVNVLENGLKKERDIETGDENQTQTIVVKGLSVGDQVIK